MRHASELRIGLDPRTKQAMKEFFDGHFCRECGFQAQRFLAGGFYCHDCGSKQQEPIVLQEKRYLGSKS